MHVFQAGRPRANERLSLAPRVSRALSFPILTRDENGLLSVAEYLRILSSPHTLRSSNLVPKLNLHPWVLNAINTVSPT